MTKYLKGNSQIVEAFKFSHLKLDEFFEEFGGISNTIIIRLSAEEKSVEISYPFEEQKSIKAFSGDYLVRGEEIPRSIPTPVSYTHLDLEEWISSFYAGEIEYEIPWRGDPRTDANDLFYMELKNGSERMIRTYENSLSFNGAWSGKMKARAVVLNE